MRDRRVGCLAMLRAIVLRGGVSAGFLLVFLFSVSQPGHAIPAFARKYGLPCSACHIGWPILNNFGLAFRDNGYQLGNSAAW